MNIPNPETFAAEWIAAWNSHDLERILHHYADDMTVTSPMIKVTLGTDDGTVHGKAAVREYWGAALQKIPDLHFELVECTQGFDSIALYYKSVMGKMAVEVMFFDDFGKISRVIAHYN